MSNDECNRLSRKQVDLAVHSWSVRFHEAKYGPEQLRMLANEYFDDLVAEGVTAGQFLNASLMARRRCKWFPKMAELLVFVEEVRARPPETVPTCQLLPDTTAQTEFGYTPEEQAKIERRIKAISSMLAGKLSMDEALEEVERANDVREFGGGMVG